MGKSLDLTGKRFGRLTVIEATKNSQGEKVWKCQCDCGNISFLKTRELNSGNTKSCGCLQKEKAREIKTKHGFHGERLYRIWCNMKSRCSNPNTPAYKNYGGRGISVCEEWKSSYVSFREWCMNNGYNEELTLERKDVNKGYEPDNCTFISKRDQPKNTRRCHFVMYKGEIKTLTEWSRKLNFGRKNFRNKRNMFASDEETIDFILSRQKGRSNHYGE